MSVAEIIEEQIGRRALYMIGAKGFRSLEGKGLAFRIGRSPKRVNAIAIYLDPSDTYRIKYFHQHRAPSHRMELLAEESDIYAEDLRASIERNTGLLTSL